MEQIRRILDRIARERKEGVVYVDVFEEVLTLLQARLVQLAGVKEDEVAILLMDSRRNLKFYRPKYLERSGLIPASYTRSFVTKTIQSGRPRSTTTSTPPSIWPCSRNSSGTTRTWNPSRRCCASPCGHRAGLVFGALEFGRKGASPEAAGRDWSPREAETLAETVQGVVDLFHQLCLMAKVLN